MAQREPAPGLSQQLVVPAQRVIAGSPGYPFGIVRRFQAMLHLRCVILRQLNGHALSFAVVL